MGRNGRQWMEGALLYMSRTLMMMMMKQHQCSIISLTCHHTSPSLQTPACCTLPKAIKVSSSLSHWCHWGGTEAFFCREGRTPRRLTAFLPLLPVYAILEICHAGQREMSSELMCFAFPQEARRAHPRFIWPWHVPAAHLSSDSLVGFTTLLSEGCKLSCLC